LTGGKSIPDNSTAEQSLDNTRLAILIEAALHIDKPYANHPAAPRTFDCSTFINYIFAQTTDLRLPIISGSYRNVGEEISFADAEPGDLLIFASTPGGDKINHVAALYQKSATGELRGSLLIHAVSIPTQSSTIKGNPNTTGVKITELGKRGDGAWQKEYFISRYLTCRRVLR
jgi:cell wall-associated NlpC family hydrolase